MTWSTRCAPVCDMRRAPHEGQKPRRLRLLRQQLVATALAAAQPQEAVGQDAALEEGVELVLDEAGPLGARAGFGVGDEAAGMAEQAQTVQAIASDRGGEDFQWATTPEERTRLWTVRHHAYFAALQLKPGCRCVNTDTCVPISRLGEIINESQREADEAGLPYFIVGHVGDGNFHLGTLVDPDRPEERALAERLSAQMVQRALQLEGTCTGEHGVGLHKMASLLDEAGAGGVALMRDIKRALDPKNILNSGKILAF